MSFSRPISLFGRTVCAQSFDDDEQRLDEEDADDDGRNGHAEDDGNPMLTHGMRRRHRRQWPAEWKADEPETS